MGSERLILAIGRIERALSKLEQYTPPKSGETADPEIFARHEKLKSEGRAAVMAIDSILARAES